MRGACFVGDGHSGRVSAGAGFDGLIVRCTLSTCGPLVAFSRPRGRNGPSLFGLLGAGHSPRRRGFCAPGAHSFLESRSDLRFA